MSQHENDSVSRRRVLQAAAAIIPLRVGSRVAAVLTPFDTAGTTQQLGARYRENPLTGSLVTLTPRVFLQPR